jgi:hypothetical protein
MLGWIGIALICAGIAILWMPTRNAGRAERS